MIRDLLVIVVIAITVSFLVRTFIVRSFYIPSGSMENTLQVNDRILVNQLQPQVFPLQRGDIVVFKDPGGWLPPPSAPEQSFWGQSSRALLSLVGGGEDTDEHLIKRVIGLPGDNVVCCDALGNLEINGQPINEPYIVHSETDINSASLLFDVVVPADSLWVMGDNRFNSKDSSKQQSQPGKGFVKLDSVVGRAVVVSWPMDHWALLDDYPAVFAGVD
ncbi:signal peptidase I [Microterricola gilva]|uniref:signal peptidase I n=1 Tax=Microterricola gilva TaxID=393267 RepID=UPI0024151782|nr:signal peptidase I [Microterricola gilva]